MAGIGSEALAQAGGGTLEEDHRLITESCGVLDRSERGKLALGGADAREFLNGQVTNELMTLRPGEGCYAAFLTHKGKMLGDLRILAVADEQQGADAELLLDTERTSLQALFDMIRRFKVGYDVALHKRTLERGLLSLLGPDADLVAFGEAHPAGAGGAGGGATDTPPGTQTGRLPLAEHASAPVEIDGIAALAVRTDLGVDLLCDAADTEGLRGVLRARGAPTISEQAAECLRVEHGRPRYGIDLDDTVIPQEAGLNERAVSFTKGCYVGQETVARLYYKGKPNRHLRGLRLSGPGERDEELVLGERVVGRVGSVALSPRLGPIALALVRREAEPGSVVGVGTTGTSAEVLELPFPAA
jgi:tRNA-modifying protein YgfZ